MVHHELSTDNLHEHYWKCSCGEFCHGTNDTFGLKIYVLHLDKIEQVEWFTDWNKVNCLAQGV